MHLLNLTTSLGFYQEYAKLAKSKIVLTYSLLLLLFTETNVIATKSLSFWLYDPDDFGWRQF